MKHLKNETNTLISRASNPFKLSKTQDIYHHKATLENSLSSLKGHHLK